MKIDYSLGQLSRTISGVEIVVACVFLFGVVVLLFMNVAMRAAGAPIFWGDEAMVSLMGGMAAFATSALIAEGGHAKVDLLHPFLSPKSRFWLERFCAFATLVFSVTLVWLSWRLFDPVSMIKAGFNIKEFVSMTRNFAYREPTNTLGIARFWTWIPLSIAALGMVVHSLAWLLSSQSAGAASRVDAESLTE